MRLVLTTLAACCLLAPPVRGEHHHHHDHHHVPSLNRRHAEPACPAADGEPIGFEVVDDPQQPAGPLVELGLKQPPHDFINWLSSTDQPKTLAVVPPQRLFVRISGVDERQSPFFAKWVEVFLDGRVVSNPTTIFKSLDPQYAELEIDCPPPGRHVVQARYLGVDGRWSRYSQPIYFDVQRPAAPQLVGLCDGHNCPSAPVVDGLAVIRTSSVTARLASVQNLQSVVAYIDGITAPCKQIQNCGVEVGLQDLTPGMHTLAFRVVGDGKCSVGGELSPVTTFQYSPLKRQAAWSMIACKHPCASNTEPCNCPTCTAITAQAEEAHRQRAEAEKQRAEAEKQRAEAEKQRAEAEKQKAEALKQQAEAKKQRAEAQKQEAEAHKQWAETAKQQAEAAKQQAETAKQQAEAAKQKAGAFKRKTEAPLPSSTPEGPKKSTLEPVPDDAKVVPPDGVGGAERRNGGSKPSNPPNSQSPRQVPNCLPLFRLMGKPPVYFTAHTGAPAGVSEAMPASAHSAASNGSDTHADKPGQATTNNPCSGQATCPSWKEFLAFDRNPQHAPVEDGEDDSKLCYDCDYAFPDPAHFPAREFGNRGEVFPREGLVIYEGMRLRWCSQSGQYEVSFVAEAPPEPVTLRLQFIVNSNERGNYTITLPPIRLDDSDTRSQRESKSWTIRHTGYSPALAKGGFTDVRRSGTARFGFNTTREKDE